MKYIDTDKLIIEIEKRVTDLDKYKDSFETAACYQQALVWVKDFISSLQQEQPEVQNGKFVFPKYLYARTKDNKTIDMSYAPQDMTAVEYIRNDSIEQEQPEVADTGKMDSLEYWLRQFGMPEENIKNCITQIAHGYGAIRYLEGVQNGAEAVNELAQQEQPEIPSGEDVMTMCNQILIGWVKEGKTPEEVESREEAHSRFFELYDEYITQVQPEVELEKAIDEYFGDGGQWKSGFCVGKKGFLKFARHFWNKGYNARKEE